MWGGTAGLSDLIEPGESREDPRGMCVCECILSCSHAPHGILKNLVFRAVFVPGRADAENEELRPERFKHFGR